MHIQAIINDQETKQWIEYYKQREGCSNYKMIISAIDALKKEEGGEGGAIYLVDGIVKEKTNKRALDVTEKIKEKYNIKEMFKRKGLIAQGHHDLMAKGEVAQWLQKHTNDEIIEIFDSIRNKDVDELKEGDKVGGKEREVRLAINMGWSVEGGRLVKS
jgi:hypothetical protein